jgi:C_GCAxxG_C_C family probable redox protein
MNRVEKATERFLKGYNCAQSVLYAFCEDLNLNEETALKISSGFGGGMGGKQEVCGAVTGGIMVLGMKYSQGENDDKTVRETTYKKTRELMERFSGRNGSCICGRLISECNLTTREGQKLFKQKDLLNRICKPCVQSSVEILENIVGLAPRQDG